MAFSQSIRRAQVPKTCELCETDTKIKWKCVQCNTLMCDKCKKIHLKVQTSITHDIVDVKSSEANLDMEHIITDNIPCQIHKRKLNCMFCRTCNNLVCPDCITASHNKHELDSIDTECNGQRETLKALESIFSEQITLCEIEDSKVKDFKAKYEQFSAESLQKTYQQEQLIKDEVSKYALALRKQLKNERQRIEKSIIEKEKHTAEVKETLLNKQRNIQEVLESKQAAQVFSAYSEFSEKEISNVSFKGFPEETKKFTPTNDSKKIISNFFGSLHMTKLPIKGLPHMCLDVIKSYTTDLNMVESILIQDNKTAWISNSEIPTLRKINIDDKITTVKEVLVKIYDMSLTENNDILLSLCDSTYVSLLTAKTGEFKPFLSVSQLYPRGIHVTKHNDIILGVRERGKTYNISDKSCRKIVIFGMDRKQKQSYEYDKHKQRIFTLPVKITSNRNNDILVIDNKTDLDGRVVALDKEGQVKWTYHGRPRVIQGDGLFNPKAIATTSLGYVLVTDIINHALHVLSGEGDILTCKVMENQGITFPLSLDIGTVAQFLVGCYSGDEEKKDAKLHVVKMSF